MARIHLLLLDYNIVRVFIYLGVEGSELAKILVFRLLLDNDLGGEVLFNATINYFCLFNGDRVSLVEQPRRE